MRRVGGVHVRTNRAKAGILHNSSADGAAIRSALVHHHLSANNAVRRLEQSVLERQMSRVKRENLSSQSTVAAEWRRKRLMRGESPRTGLLPSETIVSSQSNNDIIPLTYMEKVQEHRKLSDFGVVPHLIIEEEDTTQTTASAVVAPKRKSRSFRRSFIKRKRYIQERLISFRNFFRMAPTKKKFSLPPSVPIIKEEGADETKPEKPKEQRKSLAICENTCEALRRSFRKDGHIACCDQAPVPPINLLLKTHQAPMDRLGRVWTKLSATHRRPTLDLSDESDDEDLPSTKNAVFQMFREGSSSHHRSSGPNNSRKDATSSAMRDSLSPNLHNRLVSSSEKSQEDASPEKEPVPHHHRRKSAEAHANFNLYSKEDNMSASIHRNFNAAVRVTDTPETSKTDSGRRRNSVFIKRGSISMEPIKKVDLDEVYAVYKQLGTGRFGYIKLAEHKQSRQKIAIKFFPRPQTKQVDFTREYNYSFFLSPHPHIIDTYEGMYQSTDDSAFFFVQEFCPRASLREAVEATNQQGIGEANTKKVFAGILSALEFMHDEHLVHRNLKAENILIFDVNDFSKVKVADFGLTRKVDSNLKNLEYVNQYHAPELCETVQNEVLTVSRSTDIWSLGVIFFYCIRGRFPWQKATIMCKAYWEWEQWLKRKNPILPKKWLPLSEKGLKLMKKTLTPRPKDRWTAKDMRKCIAKEKVLKPLKSESSVEYVYHPTDFGHPKPHKKDDDKSDPRKKSTLQHWISTTLSTMAEISEQVVSARDD